MQSVLDSSHLDSRIHSLSGLMSLGKPRRPAQASWLPASPPELNKVIGGLGTVNEMEACISPLGNAVLLALKSS
jgi:hypothetical protein